MQKLFIIAIAALVVFSGCTEDGTISAPDALDLYKVKIIGADWTVKAFEGSERELYFIVSMQELDGTAAAEVAVGLSLIGAKGLFDPAGAVTDASGMIEATVTIDVPLGKSAAQLLVNAGGVTQTQEIVIEGLKFPSSLRLSSKTPEVRIVGEQNVEIAITASATDDHGVGIAGIDLKLALKSPAPEGRIFGSISQPKPTDEKGQSTVTFSSLGGIGSLIVACDIYGLAEGDSALKTEITIRISTIENDIAGLTLVVEPEYLKLAVDSVGQAKVYARVTDVNNNGIPKLKVDFSCQYGTIGNVTLTDETGLATADYMILPLTDFPEDVQQVIDNIRATIPNTGFTVAREIRVEPMYTAPGHLQITSDREFIYADFGLTVAHLRIHLKDNEGQAISGQRIILTSTHGTVNSPVITDSLGLSRAVFTDVGLPSVEGGEIVPAVITASYEPMALEESIEITIEERNPVDAITLWCSENQMTAGSGDSTQIYVMCFLRNGAFAPEGTLVYFETDLGYFNPNPDTIRGNNGTVMPHFFPGSIVGTAHCRAYVMNGDSALYSPVWEIRIVAGPPTRVSVTADPNRLNTTEPTVFSRITATVRDTANNIVGEGFLVTFEATLGSLNRLSRSTNEDGQAIVELTPGVRAGISVVTATVSTPAGDISGTTTVEIIAGDGNSIELTANPMNIAVRGTGVNSSSTLTATLWDANRNLIETANWVIFEILNEPPPEEGGCYFGNGEQIDSSQTTNGQASVTLNAGTVLGLILIRATAYLNNRQDTLTTTRSLVLVEGGPPDRIDVDFDNRGIDAGGGAWQIETSAHVFDRYMNPVADSIPVRFFATDTVVIIEGGWTGNRNRRGVSTSGIAFASLVYNSSHTFDTLTVRAEVQSVEGIISGRRFLRLPLQQGILTLDVSPETWMIDQGPDSCNFTCLAELRDGHGVAINNAPVLFTASRGAFFWYNHMPGRRRYILYDPYENPPQLPIKYTGWNEPEHPEHREEPGQATVFMRGAEWTFFLDPVTPEVAVQIGARVVGYDDVEADPVVVFVTRHP